MESWTLMVVRFVVVVVAEVGLVVVGALGKEPFDVRKYDGLIGREFGRRAIRYKAI